MTCIVLSWRTFVKTFSLLLLRERSGDTNIFLLKNEYLIEFYSAWCFPQIFAAQLSSLTDVVPMNLLYSIPQSDELQQKILLSDLGNVGWKGKAWPGCSNYFWRKHGWTCHIKKWYGIQNTCTYVQNNCNAELKIVQMHSGCKTKNVSFQWFPWKDSTIKSHQDEIFTWARLKCPHYVFPMKVTCVNLWILLAETRPVTSNCTGRYQIL